VAVELVNVRKVPKILVEQRNPGRPRPTPLAFEQRLVDHQSGVADVREQGMRAVVESRATACAFEGFGVELVDQNFIGPPRRAPEPFIMNVAVSSISSMRSPLRALLPV